MGKADVTEFGRVRIVEDLHSTVDEVVGLGFRVLRHWSGVDAVSERDAYAITCRREMLAEQHDVAQREWRAAQEAWHRDRSAAYLGAAAAALPRSDAAVSPRDAAEARVAGLRAMLAWEKHNPPTSVELPAGLATDPETLGSMEAALDGTVPAGRWTSVGV